MTAPGDIIDRLVSVLGYHVGFHIGRAGEVFIGNSELWGLLPEPRKQTSATRGEYEGLCFSNGTTSGNPFGR